MVVSEALTETSTITTATPTTTLKTILETTQTTLKMQMTKTVKTMQMNTAMIEKFRIRWSPLVLKAMTVSTVVV